jgi:hypothetical protein
MFSAWAEIKSHKSNAYGWVLSCRVTFNKQIRISYTAKYSETQVENSSDKSDKFQFTTI